MPLIPNTAYNAEDKILMQKRGQLEGLWFSALTAGDRAAWLAHWVTRPPMDIQFRTYSPAIPTAFNMVQVLPQVAYAWSQIYGTYRFGNSIVTSPSALVDPVISSSGFTPHVDTLPITYSITPDPGPDYQIIIFASGPSGPKQGNGRSSVRPMCFNTQSDPAEELDFLPCWMLRYGGPPEGHISCTCGFVNANNELVASPDTLDGEVS